MKYLATLYCILFFSITVISQDVVRRNDTVIVMKNGEKMSLPWGGGLNGVSIDEIDFNFDGVMDLFVYEANNRWNTLHGGRVTPLIAEMVAGKKVYTYKPEYINHFPRLGYFVWLRDYNNDGKMDLFCSNDRYRLSVYRNDGNAATGLKFTLFINDLSATANGYPPTYTFHPDINQDFVNRSAFEDIDGDGDIDLLVLDRPEDFIEYYKNVSPTTDTIMLELKSTCWGNAAVGNDTIILGVCNKDNVANPENVKLPKSNPPYNGGGGGKGSKDAGISLLAIDLNGDGVKDLISGTPFKLRMAMNNGTKTASNFGSAAPFYPISNPVHNFTQFAIPSFVDVDHDNVKDLVVSPIWDEYKDYESLYFYKNTGSNSTPNFSFQHKSLFQNEMIDVGRNSHPVFFDYNGDGLLDIVVGNEGYLLNYVYPIANFESKLALYKNVGTKYSPEFEWVTNDYLGLSTVILDSAKNKPATGLHPTFGDMDNDGDMDMFLGDANGRLHYFENTAGPGVEAVFSTPVINYNNIDIGNMAAPQLIDLNRDGKLDLVVGELEGNLNYFENSGSKSIAQFSNPPDSNLGNVLVNDQFYQYGNSVPYIYEDYKSGEYFLICGSRTGYIFFFDSLEVNGKISSNFRVRDSSFQNIWHGEMASINGADMNGDSAIDFLVGNYSGGVVLYTGDPNFTYIPGISENEKGVEINIYPNPAMDYIKVNINGFGVNRNYNAIVYNMIGENLIDSKITNGNKLDIGTLAAGIYFLKIESKEDRIAVTQKFIKQ